MVNSVAKRVKELRKSKGLSQEELAEKSGLNTRTIQRIENGQNEPRGDSLIRLAEVLGVSTNSLFDFSQNEDNGFILLLHASALSFLLFPLLGVIVPLLLWFSKRDVVKHSRKVGRRIVNFQLTWLLMLSVIYVLFILLFFGVVIKIDSLNTYPSPLDGILILSHAIIIGLFYAANFLIIGINFFRSLKQPEFTFYPAIPFFRH